MVPAEPTQTSVPAPADTPSLLAQGAEAKLLRTPQGLLKVRTAKGYRHPHLDEQLRVGRTKYEARLLAKAKAAGIPVPHVVQQDDTTLLLDFIPAPPLKNTLDSDPLLAHTAGRILAQLHAIDIIHADLTTSNLLLDPVTKHMTIIDFGLSFSSQRDEDRAVDLHLFHQSLVSKHHAIAALAWRHFLKGYRDSYKDADRIIERLRAVEARGRNKGS